MYLAYAMQPVLLVGSLILSQMPSISSSTRFTVWRYIIECRYLEKNQWVNAEIHKVKAHMDDITYQLENSS
jgi:hypothetical protein